MITPGNADVGVGVGEKAVLEIKHVLYHFELKNMKRSYGCSSVADHFLYIYEALAQYTKVKESHT